MKTRILFYFFIILIIPFINCQEIFIDYPNEVNLNEEFKVKLKLINFSEQIYDVKIDINSDKRLSRIFNGEEWQSTYRYVNNVNFKSNEKEFLLKITEEYEGKADIIIRMRDSNDKYEEFENYSINIINNQENELNEENKERENFDEESDENGNFEEEIELRIECDEKLVNNKEFEVEIKAENLKDKEYDVKLWIENNNKVISERYDEKENEWKSGRYYINELLKGPGKEKEKIKLRLNSDYEGDAEIFLKLRGENKVSEDIEIIKNYNKTIKNNLNEKKLEIFKPEIIKLGDSKDIKTLNNIVYETRDELIRKYSIYGFTFLCVIFFLLMIIKKNGRKNKNTVYL